jgi:hypothetical protein
VKSGTLLRSYSWQKTPRRIQRQEAFTGDTMGLAMVPVRHVVVSQRGDLSEIPRHRLWARNLGTHNISLQYD